MNRLQDFYTRHMCLILDHTDFQTDDIHKEAEGILAAGLTNGNIDKPDWLGVSEDVDHLKIWDEDEGSSTTVFIAIPY